MLINLPQKDIEAALKAHIAAQGIVLAGKSVTMKFSATRKGNGVSCEMDISDMAIPGTDIPEAATPALKVVKAEKPKAVEATAEAAAPAAAPTAETPADPVVEPVKPTTSLFG